MRKRFDSRWVNADGSFTSRVRWRGSEYSDPLPPGYSMEDVAGQQARVRAKLSQPAYDLKPLPLDEAEQYAREKLAAVLAIYAPRISDVDRHDWQQKLSVALRISCDDYLDTFGADQSWYGPMRETYEAMDVAAQTAWFWKLDDLFRLPPFIDEFLLVGGQMILHNCDLITTNVPMTGLD